MIRDMINDSKLFGRWRIKEIDESVTAAEWIGVRNKKASFVLL